MSSKVRYLLPVCFLLYFINGCSKDEPAGTITPCPMSDSSLAGIYKITAAGYQADSQSVVEDWFATWDTCDRNIEYQFLPTGEYYEEVQADCGDSYYGLWHLSGTNLKIYTIDSIVITAYPISQFGCNSFTTREYKPTTGDIFTRTYTRQ